MDSFSVTNEPSQSDNPHSNIIDDLCSSLERWQEKLSHNWLNDEQNDELAPDRWKAVRDAGLTALTAPPEFGGLGLSAADLARVMEKVGSLCPDGGLGFTLATHLCSTCIPVAQFGSVDLKAALLPKLVSGDLIGCHAITEPDSGSDAFAMKTSARRSGNDYLINGEKCFISNAPIANICVVYTNTDPTKGSLDGYSAFAVDLSSEGVQIGKPRKKMGLRTAPMADLYFNNVRVPETALIGGEGKAFGILDYTMKWEILCIFALQIGEMRSQLRKVIAHARSRQQFGAPIGNYQAVSHRIADMHIRVESSADWLARAVRALSGGRRAQLEIAAAKLAISEAHVANAMDAIIIHGGAGYMSETGIEVGLRNAVGGLIYSGTSDIQRNRIAAMIGL